MDENRFVMMNEQSNFHAGSEMRLACYSKGWCYRRGREKGGEVERLVIELKEELARGVNGRSCAF